MQELGPMAKDRLATRPRSFGKLHELEISESRQNMKTGRRPDAPGRKELRGSTTKTRDNGPVAKLGRPPTPEDLPDIAADIFDDICGQLQAAEVLSPADGEMIRVLALTLADLRECESIIRKDGWTSTTSHGGRAGHPLLSERDRLRRLAVKILAECGMGPSSRGAVKKVERVDTVDTLARFRAQRFIQTDKPT